MNLKAGFTHTKNASLADKSCPQEMAYKRLSRVMLVEDDFDDQLFAREELRRLEKVGKVFCFSNGKEMVQYLRDQIAQERNYLALAPTVIVMDLNMPLMNGFETLRELKSDAVLKKIPVIVVTGEESQWEIEKAFSLRADAVFKKPLSANNLRKFFEEETRWPWDGLWH